MRPLHRPSPAPSASKASKSKSSQYIVGSTCPAAQSRHSSIVAQSAYTQEKQIRYAAAGWTAAPPRDFIVGYLARVRSTTSVPEGVHTASWRLAVDDAGPGPDPVATLAIYDRDARSVLATRALTRQEFALARRFQEFALPFTNKAGHHLELRTYYWAHAGLTQERVVVRD